MLWGKQIAEWVSVEDAIKQKPAGLTSAGGSAISTSAFC